MRNIVVWCAILLAVEVNGLYDGGMAVEKLYNFISKLLKLE